MEGDSWRTSTSSTPSTSATPRSGQSASATSRNNGKMSNSGGRAAYPSRGDRSGRSGRGRNQQNNLPPPQNSTTTTSNSQPHQNSVATATATSTTTSSTNATTSTNAEPMKLVVGQIYFGKIWTVLHSNTNRIGMYCKFSEDNQNWSTNDGFIKNIIVKPSGHLYQRGDEVKMQCTSINPLYFSLLPSFVRPLLILDVNGPLGNRTPYEKSDNSRRSFVTRKYTTEFLEICSQYYEIAVWSCAKRSNIELDLFQRINLYFIWSQEESTSLFPRTSFISPKKPLFLKELSKVFDHFPSYNYSNTVLLENHLEKFERNAFGSGIICPDFDTTRVDEDEILHPNGELMQHLIAMAGQHPINILQYIQSHTGTNSSLFPLQYPVPPELSSSSTPLEEKTPTSLPSFTDHDLLWNYLLHTCNQNPKVAQQCLDQKSLPGPKATPFRSSHLNQIQTTPNNYLICEKTDGDRAILVISPTHHEVYFIYRNHQVERLHFPANKQDMALNWLQSLQGITVFDGELVSEYLEEGGGGEGGGRGRGREESRAAFLCFDVVFLNGQFIGNQVQYNLMDRLDLAKEWLANSLPYLEELYLQQHETIRSKYPLLFQCKEMVRVREIVTITNKMKTNPDHGWIYDFNSHFPHLCDGLVFTPIQGTYYQYMAIKWKPAELCTNDYWISLNDLRKVHINSNKHTQVTGYLSFSSKQSDLKIPIVQIRVTSQQYHEILSQSSSNNINTTTNSNNNNKTLTPPTNLSHLLVECWYDKQQSLWQIYKIRSDKLTSNSIQAAWSNLEVISEDLNFITLIETFQNLLEPSEKNVEKKINNHYNEIQILRQSQHRENRIAMHRKVMNWSKACLLQHILFIPYEGYERGDVDSQSCHSHDCHSYELYYQEKIQQILTNISLKNYLEHTANPPDILKNISSQKKSNNSQFPRKKGKKMTINVVDLACGRGGDIRKFTSETKVGTYLGIDISEEQIKECIERTRENRDISSSYFHQGDAGDGKWYTSLPPLTVEDSLPHHHQQDQHHHYYDIAWCMFAFHYFCDSESHCRQFLSSVAYLLKPNGKFSLTFPNPYAIYAQLTKESNQNEAKIGAETGVEAEIGAGTETETKPEAEAEMKTATKTNPETQPICSVTYHSSSPSSDNTSPNEINSCPYTLHDCLNQFGLQYYFTLGDAVQNCPEYLVPLHRLLSLAKEYHLHLFIEREGSGQPLLMPMNEWIENYCLKYESYLSLRSTMQVNGMKSPGRNVSSEEWEAISLYLCLTFVKIEK